MDQAGDILLMLQALFENLAVAGELHRRLCDGIQHRALAVELQVFHEQEGMIALLLGLDLIPVAEAVELAIVVIVREIEVEVGGVEFLGDLLIEQLYNFLIEHGFDLLFLLCG